MTNFLPQIYAKQAASDYRSRLFFVAFSLASVAFLVAIALALPSYLLLRVRAAAISPTDAQAAASAQGIEDSVRAATAKAAAVGAVAREERMASVIERVISRRTAGIVISGLSFRRGDSGAISLSGVAATREGLVSFVKSLEAEPAFSNVVLPVSALAKGKDISFSISLTSKF
jgi:hypothetical protein